MGAYGFASFDAGLAEVEVCIASLERGDPPPFGKSPIAVLRELLEDLALLSELGYRVDVDAARRERLDELVKRLRSMERAEGST
jgi:hypothetical protein